MWVDARGNQVREEPYYAGENHKDDGGAPELSTIMLVALIAIPLIIGVILFGQNLWTRFKGRATEAGTQAGALDANTSQQITIPS